MCDPDLAVYYFDSDRDVAGVEQLAAYPYLIAQPIDPVRSDPATANAYWQEIADIYSSTSDNRFHDHRFAGPSALHGELVLPVGASFTCPGKWADGPVGLERSAQFEVPAYAQARLDLPAGFDGSVRWPFVLWSVQGAGQVSVSGIE